jgi:hypothetical protein
LTAVTANTGNSLSIRNFDQSKRAKLVALWAKTQAAGILRVRGPEFHDNVQGLRTRIISATPLPEIPYEYDEPLKPVQNLTVELAGSSTSGNIELAFLHIYYPEIVGLTGNYVTWEKIRDKINHVLGVEVSITGLTSGQWGTSTKINNNNDNFKADTWYALLGYTVDALCGAVRFQAPETGNLGVAGPGFHSRPDLTRDWFARVGYWTGLPSIPVINANNKGSTLVDVATDQAGGTFNVTAILAELSGKP